MALRHRMRTVLLAVLALAASAAIAGLMTAALSTARATIDAGGMGPHSAPPAAAAAVVLPPQPDPVVIVDR